MKSIDVVDQYPIIYQNCEYYITYAEYDEISRTAFVKIKPSNSILKEMVEKILVEEKGELSLKTIQRKLN
jgi:hypothetical protein